MPITQAPALNITKSDATASSVDAAGDLIHYTLTVTNTGNQTLTGVEVSDPRIANLDCDDQTPGNQTTGFTLAPGGTLTCTGTYTVTQGDIDDNGGGDGDIDNTATADSNQTGPDTDSAVVPITQAPALNITKVAQESSVDAAGDLIHYTLTVTNTGNQTLTGVEVSDPRIANLDCDDQTPGNQTTGFTLAPGGTLTCTGTYTVTQGDIDDNGGGDGDIDNTATADSNQTGPDTDSAVVPITQAPALNITKVAQESSVDAAGDLIHYTLTVTNTGNQTLTGVEVSDPRIANLDCDDQTPGNQTTGFTLAPGGTLTCTGTYTVTQGDIDDNGGGDGDIDNTATADSNQTGPDTDSAVVPITQAPALNITKVAQESSVDAAGDLIHYTLTVTNTGNQTLTGVEVSDPRIANLDCDDQTPGNQTTGFTLAPGGTLTCTGTYTVTQGDIDDNGGGDGDIDNTATADSNQTGPDTDSAVVPITQAPALNITKVAQGARSMRPAT